ncbi:MAG: hypothetical protein AAGJ85_05330, partial [Pseudomonadota bacterium]
LDLDVEPAPSDEELFAEDRPAPEQSFEETYTSPPEAPRPDISASPSRVTEEDLFEANADKMADAVLNGGATEEARGAVETEIEPEAPEPAIMDAVFEETEPLEVNGIDPDAGITLPPKRAITSNGSASLSDIIADMEREDSPALSREETAEELIDRLTDSGIKLSEIFKPRDKKKIALAARKGDGKRRISTRQSAGRQVERVRGRLRSDSDLMALARDFIALEESDALNALENTRESKKHASPRLATYLLLDAALD